MGTVERKQRQREEVHALILKAAWKLVKEEGWQGLSLRKIAGEIEYSIPVIYDHFENKEAILREFTRQGFKLLNNEIKSAADAVNDPESKLKAIAYAYWRFAVHNPEYYQLMYGLGMPGCETVQEMTELSEFTVLLKNSVSALIKTNGNEEANAFGKMKSFWSMLHGFVSINMMDANTNSPSTNDVILQEYLRDFITGIKA
jgi:AcrR family transcriptional regulator